MINKLRSSPHSLCYESNKPITLVLAWILGFQKAYPKDIRARLRVNTRNLGYGILSGLRMICELVLQNK